MTAPNVDPNIVAAVLAALRENGTDESLGARAQRVRAALRLSQSDLAKQAEMSPVTLANLERGKTTMPHPSTERRLTAVLDRLETRVDPAPVATTDGHTVRRLATDMVADILDGLDYDDIPGSTISWDGNEIWVHTKDQIREWLNGYFENAELTDEQTDEQTPTQERRTLRARIAAHSKWSKTEDTAAATAPARQAFLDQFYLEVDPEGILNPVERARRAKAAKSAHFARMALKSAQVRGAKREQTGGAS